MMNQDPISEKQFEEERRLPILRRQPGRHDVIVELVFATDTVRSAALRVLSEKDPRVPVEPGLRAHSFQTTEDAAALIAAHGVRWVEKISES